jgi:hypothetical protein
MLGVKYHKYSVLLAGVKTDAEISKKTVWELFQAAPESEVRSHFTSFVQTDP